MENYFKYSSLKLTDSWIVNTWRFMSEHNIRINTKIPNIPLARENDCNIMKKIIGNSRFTKDDIKIINKCRLYLQVFNLSDITTEDGLRIRDSDWNGVRKPQNTNSNITWPHWNRPSSTMWKTWQAALSKTFCSRLLQCLD